MPEDRGVEEGIPPIGEPSMVGRATARFASAFAFLPIRRARANMRLHTEAEHMLDCLKLCIARSLPRFSSR